MDSEGVIQTIPYTEQSWHAGRTANTNFIGIELCHANNIQEFEKIWNNAVELFAKLFEEYGWEVNENTLLSHCQVSNKWLETDHTDPVGYFRKFGKTVEDFRYDVKSKTEGEINMSQYQELSDRIEKLERPMVYNFVDSNMPSWARESVKRLVNRGVLKGGDSGLGLDENMLRMAVMLDRALESTS